MRIVSATNEHSFLTLPYLIMLSGLRFLLILVGKPVKVNSLIAVKIKPCDSLMCP